MNNLNKLFNLKTQLLHKYKSLNKIRENVDKLHSMCFFDNNPFTEEINEEKNYLDDDPGSDLSTGPCCSIYWEQNKAPIEDILYELVF